ncbi:cupin domain-containing protein [Gammaproteobacteria bacterium AH-315-E17]|nr:cupin domain-containing protein [bacterium AH-315-I11]MBN4075845.1 cupin domain-containing protein [Gammaproteobacteria bacterium AH-315-E17]
MSAIDKSSEYYFREGCFITELSNSVDDPELSVAHVRVEPGETTRWHKLLGISERYLILSGKGRVEVGNSEAREVTESDVVLISPEVKQRITNTGEEDLIFLALCTPRFEESYYIEIEDKIDGASL